MIRPIVAYGDPVLKKDAEEVAEDHPDLSGLLEDMWETMYEADGVGLAAPQIGLSLRLFVADGSPFGEGENGDLGCVGFKRVMINPVLFDLSEEVDSMEEGCLSIPGVREPVSRPVRIGVEYYDAEWNLVEEHLEGLAARIVQHENDHLLYQQSYHCCHQNSHLLKRLYSFYLLNIFLQKQELIYMQP